ncbi:amino acid aminotransferase [Pseudoblastomonas halimionae]|uniref:Aminotransferase class I/II-fold pyridoxal phosphate-dependent enzyme n=1 Tax=Alteriqipengyuania halimionae TaxID=1926630 RepID=A0A6I4U691_9SPHN|nr:amino acid aminotransferase [Alteriqipengyuania halimionae]MXP10383.1 aminotransferase class I/II-fold pyridoxal phosphate-dependent enzyme [Alteriqipengyuania halimionae]
MLERLDPQAPDALLALIKMFNDDPREDKIDLGVGVYRDEEGRTPVFRAIKAAEEKLHETQDSKSYLGPEGDSGFVNGLMPYIFGDDDPTRGGRIAGMQTPGGTGAVRLAFALAQAAGGKSVVLGEPSWPNHRQIAKDIGLDIIGFDHAADAATTDFGALEAAIEKAQPGDVLLLHGSSHNPTGIDYTVEQWERIAELSKAAQLVPVLDIAYQGLGEGLEEDVAGMRAFLAAVPEAMVTYSCDKNFGLYRDRVGAFYVLAADRDILDRAISNANSLARANWSMPPDHGGATVRVLLRDADLTAQWKEELTAMRGRLRWIRDTLAKAGTTGAIDLTPLGEHNGLFSMLPVDSDQVAALRKDHGIYMAGSGRINIAGLNESNIDRFIAALADVTG